MTGRLGWRRAHDAPSRCVHPMAAVANGSYEHSPTQNCKLNVNIMRMFCDCFKNLIVKFP